MKAMRSAIRELNFRHQTQMSLEEIARRLGVDRVLRAILSIGTVPSAPVRQPDVTGLGDAKVQTL
jgi:hypothetical protein